jgi:ribonucleoside-diphosphate reductase alpha chain
VREPFTGRASFDEAAFAAVARTAVRMLDNVLDASTWPLPQQRAEAQAKRRIGLGFTGLGDCLIMLGLRYDSDAARARAADFARLMRDAAYAASVELAREKGPFPLFDADKLLAAPSFASRLPEPLKAAIREHGLRNSHLLSIAPTGTISLAFADNASNGIEPPFSWHYTRKKRMPDDTLRSYAVEDHAWRLYRHRVASASPADPLPPAFVTALELSALDHMRMSAAVQPYIDTAISKTVNVPEDYPFEAFEDLYLQAWQAGLKGITTYRPNTVIGSVLETVQQPAAAPAREDLELPEADRRLVLERTPTPPLASLRWPGRPALPNGNPSWTYAVDHPLGDFAVFIGHIENDTRAYPFEVWVNGSEQPRGLGAVAKSLSMDMRVEDRKPGCAMKLDGTRPCAGATTCRAAAAAQPAPASSCPAWWPGSRSWLHYRCERVGAFTDAGNAATPMMDALISAREPTGRSPTAP